MLLLYELTLPNTVTIEINYKLKRRIFNNNKKQKKL